MATDNNLMNTQTGGEGETVQIQTQEQVTPEQFDVKIKAQETSTDSEQQVVPTEPPVEPPVQREGMVEVQGAPPSEFVEAQETFNEVPVELPPTEYKSPFVSGPSLDVDEYGNLIPPKQEPKIEAEPPTEFVDNPVFKSLLPPPNNVSSFKQTEKQINEDLNNSELGSVVDMYNENKERGDGIFGKMKGFFRRKEEEPKQETINIGGVQLGLTKGDEISEEDFVAAGGDAMTMKIPISDPTKKPEESGIVNQPLTFEESITTEDLTNVVDEGTVISEFNKLVLEREKVREQIRTAQGEDLKSLRKSLKTIKGTLNDLQKSDDFKQQKKEYTQNTLKAGALPADYYVKKDPIKSVTDLTYHPSNYMVIKPFDSDISKQVFQRQISEGGMSEEEAKDVIKDLFTQESESYLGGMSKEEWAAQKVKSIIQGVSYTTGKELRKPLRYEEVKVLDNYFKSIANWAKENGGKQKNGMLRSVLFPEGGYLPSVTVQVPDKDGVSRTVTLFKDVYDTEKNVSEVRNNFGMPWNKASFQYKSVETKSGLQEYYVPDSLINQWKKTVTGFNSKTLQQQQNLARKKDKNGKPYLQSDAGIFGVGVTGVMDNATRDAQKRYEADLKGKRAKTSTRKGAVSKLEGGFAAKGADIGEEWSIEETPIYKWKTTGKASGSYGGIDVSKIPLDKITTTEEAMTWAKGHLPTAKQLIFDDANILLKSEEDFKSYIEGLGTGVTVEEGGGLFNMDFVTLYPPAGVIATPLEIDLGENWSPQLKKDTLDTLSNWMKYAQKDPRADFIRDWTANFDQNNFLSSQILKDTALKNDFNYSGKDNQGTIINISSNDGRAKLDGYINAIKLEQEDLTKTKDQVDQRIGQYNAQVQPYIEQFQKVQDESNKQVAALQKQLDELDYKHNKNTISDEDFASSAKTINDKIIALQNNLSNSYGQLQKAVGSNKQLLSQVNEAYAEVSERNATLGSIAQDIDELAGIQAAVVASDYQGPSTVAGSFLASAWKGFLSQHITSISVASDFLIEAGLYPKGMTKEEALKMNNEWKTNFLYGELSKNLLDSMGGYKTESYSKEEGSLMQALSSVGESVGTQFGTLVRGFKGTSLAPVASFMGFASMSYNNMEQEILNNPDLKDIPEYQKKLMTIPYAIGMGAVEKLFYGKLLRGEKSAITQKLMTGIINQSLKTLPKNATLETIEAVIKGDIKGSLPKLLRAIHTAGVVGAEEEMIQAGYELGLKKTANLLLGLDAFNTGHTMEDYMKTIATNGAMGYLGGGMMGGTMRVVEKVKTGDINTLNADDYSFFKAVADNDELKKLFTEKVVNEFASGKITKADAEATMLNFENLAALDRKISDQITGEDRTKMVDLMLKKQKIQQRMSELDESQKAIPNPEERIINKQIQDIVTRTEAKIKEQEQYDQENEARVSSEIREGQELIETEPVVESSQEEAAPSGVVQEEQTEVTPTEEVVTETEITPTEPQKITSVMTTGETQLESDLIGQEVSTGKQLKTADIQTGEVTSEFREDKNPTKGTVVNVEADPKNKNIERLILEDGTVLNRNKNTGAISLNNKVKANPVETEVKAEADAKNEFDELSDINKITSPAKKRTAMKAFNEKYGEKAARISEIDSKFTSIVSKLESQNLITKKNC